MKKKNFLAQPFLHRFLLSDVKMSFFLKTLTIYWRRSFHPIVAKLSGVVVGCAFITFSEDQLSNSNTEVTRGISKMHPENNLGQERKTKKNALMIGQKIRSHFAVFFLCLLKITAKKKSKNIQRQAPKFVLTELPHIIRNSDKILFQIRFFRIKYQKF
jgi:hypothetical protein